MTPAAGVPKPQSINGGLPASAAPPPDGRLVSFPHSYAPHPAPPPSSGPHLAHQPHPAPLDGPSYRPDGRLGHAGPFPDSASAPHHGEPSWTAEQEKKDKESRAEREKIRKSHIEVLNRPAFSPYAPPTSAGASPGALDVKMEPQAHHPPQHPPQPTSTTSGKVRSIPDRRRGHHAHNSLSSSGPFFAGGPDASSARPVPESFSGPSPQVRTPFLATLSKDAPFLGRFVYGGSHWMFPTDVSRKATELTDATSRAGAPAGGGRIEVVIPAGYLGSGWSVKGDSSSPPTSEEQTTSPDGWKRLVKEVNSERRVWGTEVYTDDSDLIGVLVHSGWLIPSTLSPGVDNASEGEESKRKRSQSSTGGQGLLVALRVVGRLVRFVGTDKHGVKSRGWGNGHDGASMAVEGVAKVEVCSLSLLWCPGVALRFI